MTVHAFVDESARDGRYYVCVAVLDPGHLVTTRKQLKGLLLPGQRELHFKDEKKPRRKLLACRMAALPASVTVYYSPSCRWEEEGARQRCLADAVRRVLALGGHRLVIDSREEQDSHDRRTIRQVLGKYPSETMLAYEHMESTGEPLLWIADAVAWCYGAGGDWRRRILPIIDDVREA